MIDIEKVLHILMDKLDISIKKLVLGIEKLVLSMGRRVLHLDKQVTCIEHKLCHMEKQVVCKSYLVGCKFLQRLDMILVSLVHYMDYRGLVIDMPMAILANMYIRLDIMD